VDAQIKAVEGQESLFEEGYEGSDEQPSADLCGFSKPGPRDK
jgi:hypothetical protein